MKKAIQAMLLATFLLVLAVGCQAKKKQETATTPAQDTTTLVQSETIVSGPDSGAVMTETDRLITPDSTKK